MMKIKLSNEEIRKTLEIEELRIPEQTEPRFRRKPNPDSGACRTPWGR